MKGRLRLIAVGLVGGGLACGDEVALDLPYARSVVSFEPGPGAGFGETALPDVVLGPPMGAGDGAGSLDVLSLGVGGRIILSFGDLPIEDGPGPDIVVFENAFIVDGDPNEVFAELGRVSVSEDGQSWRAFSCSSTVAGPPWPGCAGWRPTREFDPASVLPLDPQQTGGDPFDLADVGLQHARFVRIEDLAEEGEAPNAGFDLDAVGFVRR